MPEPMTLREAIEAIKIVQPHVAALRTETTGFGLCHHLFDMLYEDHPSQPFRLLGLMYHKTPDEMALELQSQGGKGVIVALMKGIAANPLPDLINMGFLLGLVSEAWNG